MTTLRTHNRRALKAARRRLLRSRTVIGPGRWKGRERRIQQRITRAFRRGLTYGSKAWLEANLPT